MGSKTAARAAAQRAGVAVVPGTDAGAIAADATDDDVRKQAEAVGYPLLVKAVSGGGGKGMRTVTNAADLAGAVRAARSEAGTAFGDAAVYFERQMVRPRHVEIQILGDEHGTVLPFVERECSIQRRHQKVVEETPSPVVSAALRQALTAAAAAVMRSVGYSSAGTVEFLLNEDGSFYFLEVNTRLQVEHPVTEMVTGVDLVQWQIRIARGERLNAPAIDPERLLAPRGHAIECRIYAEDPDNQFLPSPGQILGLREPAGPAVRVDSGIEAGFDVPMFYDPMLSKLIVWGEDRDAAIGRLRRALGEYYVSGVRTTLPFFRWLLEQPEFMAGLFHTTYMDEALQARNGEPFGDAPADVQEIAAIAAAVNAILTPPSRNEPSGAAQRWKVQARADSLRD